MKIAIAVGIVSFLAGAGVASLYWISKIGKLLDLNRTLVDGMKAASSIVKDLKKASK